jgi:hypothetical protein
MIDPDLAREHHPSSIRIRALTVPSGDSPDAVATRAVLVSWARANGLPDDRVLSRDPIEIRDEPDGSGRVIHYREVQLKPPGSDSRHVVTVPRTKPLLVEPVGLLNGELSCGHVSVLLNPANAHVCDQDIDPATGQHPGWHSGGPADHPITGTRANWPNEHPGQIVFRNGLPYTGDMPPTDAHALALARLTAILDARPRRDHLLLNVRAHAHGLRKLAERHAPRRDTTSAVGGPLCERRCAGWPCPDYRQALAGIVAFAPAAGR